jgi:hypothetical protein
LGKSGEFITSQIGVTLCLNSVQKPFQLLKNFLPIYRKTRILKGQSIHMTSLILLLSILSANCNNIKEFYCCSFFNRNISLGSCEEIFLWGLGNVGWCWILFCSCKGRCFCVKSVVLYRVCVRFAPGIVVFDTDIEDFFVCLIL